MHSLLKTIAKEYSGILLDAYGVFWDGNNELLPGSKDAMERLAASGKRIGILSNSSQLAAREIAKCEGKGLIQGIHFHFLVTSGEITKGLFLKGKLPFAALQKKFFLFGEPHPKYGSHKLIFQDTAYLETIHVEEADFIYPAIPHINGEDQTDPAIFREKLQALKKIPMICPNPDQFAMTGNPPKAVVRQGSIAKMYEEMGGEVLYIGKPSPLAFEYAMKFFDGCKPQDILMIGDTPETDIRGANSIGMASALLTHSGIMANRDHEQISDKPTYFLKRFAYEL